MRDDFIYKRDENNKFAIGIQEYIMANRRKLTVWTLWKI